MGTGRVRHHGAQTAEESLQLFRALLDQSNDAIEVINPKTLRLLDVNERACHELGYSRQELLSLRISDIDPLVDEALRAKLQAELSKSGFVVMETCHRRKDGSVFPVEVSIRWVVLDRAYIVTVARDITERKRAEEARFKHAAIVESSEDAIISKDLETVITSWNAGAERMFGYAEAEVLGQRITIIIPPEFRDEENQVLERLRAGGRIEHYETKRVTKIGKMLDVSVAASPIRDSGGRVVGFSKIARDITQRKQSEAALRESEERFRVAAQAGKMFAYSWDAATDVIERSGESAKILGIDEGVPLTGQQAIARVHPDDRDGVLAAMAGLSPEKPFLQVTYRIVRPDTSVLWVQRHSRAYFDEHAKIKRIVGMVVDITERKLAEEELARANERLRLAIEAGAAGGWDYDVQTMKNVWFGKAHAQLGMAPHETSELHQEFWARVHEDDRERLEGSLRVARDRKEEFAEQFRVVWRDGAIHWLRSRGRYYYAADGTPQRMLGISVDITESKLAEQALRESEQRLRLATQVGRMYAYDWDVTTDSVTRSSEHVKILGITEPLHFPHRQFVDRIQPDDRPKFLAAIAGLTPENPTGEVTYRALASDGGLVWLKSNGRGFFDAAGKLLRVIGMVADVTDQKRAEEALSEMTRKLVEAQEQERTRIARELHDDICQRIALLSFNLEELHSDFPAATERLARACQLVEELGRDIQAISHRLHSSNLEYLGLESAAGSFCKEASTLQNAQIDFRSEGVTKGIPNEISLCLFRVLQEAVQNAIKHSGVRRFEVSLQGSSNEIQLSVRDSGVGFDPEKAIAGYGIGLINMRERLKLVDGQLFVDSKPQGGTTVHARVPLRPRSAS